MARKRSLFALASVVVGLFVAFPSAAQAHGSTSDPVSRNYGCWQRWGSDFQNPAMATQDPMCWQAWQDNTNAMWNWNGLYRDGVGGNHQRALPDGTLCSGGQTEGGRYRSMDTPGNWRATTKPQRFRLNIYDQASHGADYLHVYITKQGFNPLTQRLRWSDIERVATTGRYAPSNNYAVDVNAGSRTGRHVVFTIWQASHSDQAYYLCSDVNFTQALRVNSAIQPL